MPGTHEVGTLSPRSAKTHPCSGHGDLDGSIQWVMLIPIAGDNAPSWTDIVVAISGVLTLFVALVAAIVGLGQLRSFRTNSREQTRPYLLVDLITRGTIILLELKNVGARPAANVVVKFEPEMQSTVADWQAVVRAALNESEPLPVVAPGRAINWFFDSGLFAVGNASVPQDYSVRISYEDLVPRLLWDRSRLPWRRYSERYEEHGHKLSLRQFNETALDEPGLAAIASSAAEIARKMPAKSAFTSLRGMRGGRPGGGQSDS